MLVAALGEEAVVWHLMVPGGSVFYVAFFGARR